MDAIMSHSLINKNDYDELYARIKKEHGRELVKTWTERTDPQKYVYEDCGIASYILILRQTFNLSANCFADLACGNGLLTYLLSVEGMHGCGIDARQRKIWQRFGKDVELRQMILNPSISLACEQLPSDIDFLIGNHSDELTPWIPVIAAKRQCAFFILPCCPHDFYSKFCNRPASERSDSCGESRYEQYLDYVESIGRRLGYIMHQDRLKIASAKKIGFVGIVPIGGLPVDVDEVIAQLLHEASRHGRNFRPIAAVEPVRNCTQIPWEMRQNMSRKIATLLLTWTYDFIGGWNCGADVPISQLMPELSDDEKAQLKSQFGGMQTFLRNFHQAFHVHCGRVSLRRWPEVYEKFIKPGHTKKAQCWFKVNHPQGCPLEDRICPYNHN